MISHCWVVVIHPSKTSNAVMHAWVISTGEPRHFKYPFMSISGAGPVDGHANDLSSSRGDLQSQTAMAIITNSLLQAHQATDIHVTFLGDNKGIQSKCQNITLNRLHHNRAPDVDLLLEFAEATKAYKTKSEWVKGHQDDKLQWEMTQELTKLPLSNSAILNVWCDKKLK
jgi:hypothetical protein